jgi:hypothetical protein
MGSSRCPGAFSWSLLGADGKMAQEPVSVPKERRIGAPVQNPC